MLIRIFNLAYLLIPRKSLHDVEVKRMLLLNIRKICEEKKLTIAELERRANLSHGTVYNWDKSIPSADKLAAVAKVLETTSESLLA